MHKVQVPSKNIRTDLILEQETIPIKKRFEEEYLGIKTTHMRTKEGMYTTIEFQDITDHEEYSRVEKCFKKELKRIIHPHSKDKYLIVGLGNPKSTPDSLGPKTLEYVLVTRYLFLLGDVDKNLSNVSILKTDVSGNTGISSISLLKKVVEEVNPTKVIIIDSLKASRLDRLVKTIQITNTGIHPGSGILNDQGEISKKTLPAKVIAIGIPTVVDKNTMLGQENPDNFMVTPTNIDYVIEKLSHLVGHTLNLVLHKSYFDK